jgi:heat shock protein HspQ
MSFPKFEVGQIIQHKRCDYRGVIVGVDATFRGSYSMYERLARVKRPADHPWYRVLVAEAGYEAYVSETNLELAETRSPVRHPLVPVYFDELRDGQYVMTRALS